MRRTSTALLIALFALFANPVSASQPTVTVTYSQALDSVCSVFRGGDIKDAWKAELETRKSDFEKTWVMLGPKMIAAAEEITGKSFPSGSITARLTLCNLPSQSMVGIIVNMRYALESFTKTPVPLRYKVDTLFHELLHVFLSAHPISDSELLKQHATESEKVRNHLHLLALQKAVLLKLNQPDALRDVVSIDSQLPDEAYKKAWEIINSTDAEYLKYVSEISR